jgi:hypothetical protein
MYAQSLHPVHDERLNVPCSTLQVDEAPSYMPPRHQKRVLWMKNEKREGIRKAFPTLAMSRTVEKLLAGKG